MWEGGGGGMKEPDDLSEYSKTVDYILEETALSLSLSLVRALSLSHMTGCMNHLLHARARTHTHARARAHTHTHARARAHTHTHTEREREREREKESTR